MGEFVALEVQDAVATIRLDRPPLNALSRQVQEELRDAADQVGRSEQIRAVVLYGGPRVFAAGADVKEMADWSYATAVSQVGRLQSAFTALAQLPVPVVAAVTGYALGGGLELALCADVRIAADTARLGQPEILLGIIPGAGGTQRLSRLVGPSWAKDLCFTGRHVRADEALSMGLVNQVVPAAEVYDAAHAYAARFAAGPALALRAAKEAIDTGLDVDLTSGLAVERQLFTALFATEDRQAGMRSFLENGPGQARFTGR